jgi:hypothetical protein
MTSALARNVRSARWLVALGAVALASVHCSSSSDRSDRDRTQRESAGHVAKVSSELGGWGTALPPIRIRTGHTSTLLGTGEVFIAGGGSTPKSTELLDVYSGTIALGPEMAVARTRHTATMLASGKVLVAGGGVASAELYDPVSRTFTATGTMTKERTSHAAVRLRTGKVLVVGSATGNDATAELYDPATGKFTLTSARTTTGTGAVVLLADGKALFSNDVGTEIFDPAAAGGAGAWSVAAMQAPRPTNGSAAPILTRLRDGRLYMAVGEGCASTGAATFCVGKVWNYNIGAGMTSPLFDIARVDPTAALLPTGDVIYAGGGPDPGSNVQLVTSGTPAALSTDGTSTPSHGPECTTVMLPGGDVLIIGGTQATIDRRTHFGAAHVSSGPLATPRLLQGAVRLHDGRVLLAGGSDSESVPPSLASIEIFDPATDTFSSGGAMTGSRYAHTMTTLRSGKVLLTGGGRGATVPS